MQQHHADRFHLARDTGVAFVASDYRRARMAFAAESAHFERGRTEDKLGVVAAVVEDFGVDFLVCARGITFVIGIVMIGVFDDGDVYQKTISSAQIPGAYDLFEDI